MNVRELSKFTNEETISTLDLVLVGRVKFLLMIASVEESYHLAHAAFKVVEEFKIVIRGCVLWPADAVNGVQLGSEIALAPWKNYIDVLEVISSPGLFSWWKTCQMTDKGPIFVRPDEHIAWRVKSGVVEVPILEMRRVFATMLGT